MHLEPFKRLFKLALIAFHISHTHTHTAVKVVFVGVGGVLCVESRGLH